MRPTTDDHATAAARRTTAPEIGTERRGVLGSCYCTIGGPSLAKISATDNSGVPPRLTLSKTQGFTDSYIDRDYKFPIGITQAPLGARHPGSHSVHACSDM